MSIPFQCMIEGWLRPDKFCCGQARKTPTTHGELIDYFMTTESEEMSFEVSRCRPLITDDFLKHLADQICEWPSIPSALPPFGSFEQIFHSQKPVDCAQLVHSCSCNLSGFGLLISPHSSISSDLQSTHL